MTSLPSTVSRLLSEFLSICLPCRKQKIWRSTRPWTFTSDCLVSPSGSAWSDHVRVIRDREKVCKEHCRGQMKGYDPRTTARIFVSAGLSAQLKRSEARGGSPTSTVRARARQRCRHRRQPGLAFWKFTTRGWQNSFFLLSSYSLIVPCCFPKSTSPKLKMLHHCSKISTKNKRIGWKFSR